MSRLDQIADLERRYLLSTYNRYPVGFERGKGVFLYDFEGKKYLDFVAGLGVNALGHAHTRIVKTIREQAARVIHLSNLYYNEYQGQLAERLCQLSGSNFDRVFFSNSGTEAMTPTLQGVPVTADVRAGWFMLRRPKEAEKSTRGLPAAAAIFTSSE